MIFIQENPWHEVLGELIRNVKNIDYSSFKKRNINIYNSMTTGETQSAEENYEI